MLPLRRLLVICLLALAAPAARADEGARPLPGGACAVPLPEGQPWTAAERGAWDSICRGELAEMDRADPARLPCNPALIEGEVPAHRRLGAAFLTLILTREPWVSLAARPEAHIYCADVAGDLILRNEEIPVSFGLFESRIQGKLDLQDARFGRSLHLNGSTLGGMLVGDGLQVAGDLGLRNGFAAQDALRLPGAQIGGDLSLSGGSQVAGDVLADRIRVAGAVFLGGSRFGGAFRMSGGEIGGSLEADAGMVLQGEMVMDRIAIGGNVFLGTGSRYAAEVRFVDATIGQNVQILQSATFEAAALFDRATLGGGLVVSDAGPFRGTLGLQRSVIGTDLDLRGSVFDGLVVANWAQIGGMVYVGQQSRFAGEVRLMGMQVRGNLSLTDGAEFAAPVWAETASVGGSLMLNGGSRFAGLLDFRNTRIEGLALLGDSRFGDVVGFDNARIGQELALSVPALPVPDWGPEARLILRNTETGALQADMAAWRRPDGSWLPTELTGLRYGRLGGLKPGDPAQGLNMADAPIALLLDWIEQSQPGQALAYDPQPYAQLAAVLEAQGGARAADAVRYARTEHRRTAANTPAGEKVLLFFSRLFIGYGVYPFRALWWFCALVLAGIAVTRFSDAPQLARPMSRFWYSVETAFPLMDPSASLADVRHGHPWVEQFFHFQKVAGFILATILVGSLTLLGG